MTDGSKVAREDPRDRSDYAHALRVFRRTVEEEHMAPLLAGGVAVALSGGPDSVLLLSFLKRYATMQKIRLGAVHVHHGLRGVEADRDEEFCRRLCAEWEIPLQVFHVDVPAYRGSEAGHGLSMEEAARRLRYTCFSELLLPQSGYACVATGHNATDNLETLLFRLLRGSGLRGMCGIPPVREGYVRPLLRLARREILAALREAGLSYVTDSSNLDPEAAARNYLRSEILPRLDRLQQNPEAAATRLALHLRAEESAAEERASVFFKTHFRADPVPGAGTGTLARSALAALPEAVARRVLEKLYRNAGGQIMPETVHYDALLRALPGRRPGEFCFPGGYIACLRNDCIGFYAERPENPSEYTIELHPGSNRLGPGRGSVILSEHALPEFEACTSNIYNLSIQERADSAKIKGRLIARSRRAGDAYRRGGMTRRVRRMMTDAHTPHGVRAVLPVICDETGILCVPGFGVRDGATPSTSQRQLYIYYVMREGE